MTPKSNIDSSNKSSETERETDGEERRRGATKRAEEIRRENREKEHENTSESCPLRLIKVLQWLKLLHLEHRFQQSDEEPLL